MWCDCLRCLLELHAAIKYSVPILPIKIVDHGRGSYDFEAAGDFLQSLGVKLPRVNPSAGDILKANGVHNVDSLGLQIHACLSNRISLVLDYSMSKRVIAAMKEDVLEALKTAVLERASSSRATDGASQTDGAPGSKGSRRRSV